MPLDELLLEWSYRSEKGYPNLDNPSDIFILKQILEKLNIPTDIIIEGLKELSANGLRYPIAQYGVNNDVRAGMGVSYSP